VADFLGFWGVKKPATVSRAVSKLYPYGQKREPRHKGRGLYLRVIIGGLLEQVRLYPPSYFYRSRSYPAEPGIHSLVANRIALGVVRRAGFR